MGNYPLDVEEALFGLLLFVQSGMVLDKSVDVIGCSKSTVFSVEVQPNVAPVCHALRRLNKVKAEFLD